MKPQGQLMNEHRLIEKMLTAVERIASSLTEGSYDPRIVDKVVDFIVYYSDRTHHAKEEGILFRQFKTKELPASSSRILADLVEEHRLIQGQVRDIENLNTDFKAGKVGNLEEMRTKLLSFASFYTKHIQREEGLFFPDVDKYFSPDEQLRMLNEFWEHDRKLIHQKYTEVFISLMD